MESRGPLTGVRVLDLTHTLAGPFATMILADLGAEVIKVEPPNGDETRSWSPRIDGESVYFMSVNRGKKSIVVDLKTREGVDIVRRIASRSHIVMENYRPGVRERLGVGPDDLFRQNPRLVYVSIKGFRPGSKYELKPAYDIIIQGMSGLMSSTGEEGRPPVRVSFALFDIITGLLALTYALSGLLQEEKPYYAEVYLYDAAVFAMSYIPMIYLATGRKPRRMGSAHPSIAPYQAFRAGDGKWFIVAAANDRLWARLCEAIGRRDLLDDERFKSNPDRVKNRDDLVKILEEIFATMPRGHWIRLLDEAGVPVAPVYELDEVFSDQYGRELVYEVPHPLLGMLKQLREPARINSINPTAETHPPLLGEHTIDILKWLGYSDGEIKQLLSKRIIFTSKTDNSKSPER